jgi:serine/threonine-protein phosphatase 2A regulatory subunit B''
MTRGERNYLTPDDFKPLLQDIVDTHPGLGLLTDVPDFQERYIETVTTRIFFSVNRSWTGRISIPELRKSNFLTVLALLEDEVDINQVMEYFSYEHFYVIYCKFWELDTNHDLFIDRRDLTRYSKHALPPRIIDRILSRAVLRTKNDYPAKMNYRDFVWFLLAEEDKQHPTSIEYWFRCMDLDGDGVLSMYEMEYFYEQQMKRMERMGIETLDFEDCLCQVLDMICPKQPDCITLRDLKRSKVAPHFFNIFVNLEKYLEHEQTDPFAAKEAEGDTELSAWEKFAQQAYVKLIAEEQANEDYLHESFEDAEDEELMALKTDSPSDDDMDSNQTISMKRVQEQLASLLADNA